MPRGQQNPFHIQTPTMGERAREALGAAGTVAKPALKFLLWDGPGWLLKLAGAIGSELFSTKAEPAIKTIKWGLLGAGALWYGLSGDDTRQKTVPQDGQAQVQSVEQWPQQQIPEGVQQAPNAPAFSNPLSGIFSNVGRAFTFPSLRDLFSSGHSRPRGRHTAGGVNYGSFTQTPGYEPLAARAQFGDTDIRSLDPLFQPPLARVISRLEAKGWQPHIASAVRTLDEQKEKKEKGFSPTLNSLHLKGLAVDLVDKRYGWDIPHDHQYFLDLEEAVEAEGLASGADFPTPDPAHVQIRARWDQINQF